MTDQLIAGRLKANIRAHFTGGCRRPSVGDECQCALCDVDRLQSTVAEQAAEIERWRRDFRTADDMLRKVEAVCAAAGIQTTDAQGATDSVEGFVRELVQQRDEEIERLRRVVIDGFDSHRVLDWMQDPDRKPANLAFTAGGERQAAYLIEEAQRAARAEIERLRGELHRLRSGMDVQQNV